MNDQKVNSIWFKLIPIIIAVVCLGFGIHMLYQGKYVIIANLGFSGGLGLLLAGVIIFGIGLPVFSLKGTTHYTILITILGVILFLSFLFWHDKQIVTSKEYIKYEMFRDILVIVITIAAVIITVVGFLAYRLLEKNVDRRIGEIAEEKYDRSIAVTLTNIGFMCWKYYEAEHHKEVQDILLDRAIDFTNDAFETIKIGMDEKGRKNEELICVIQNNLAYYLAECCRLNKDKEINCNLALKYAQYVYDRVDKYPHRAKQWTHTYNTVKEQCTC